MEIVTLTGSIRGAALIDYALREEPAANEFGARDLVGMIAAYAARGFFPRAIGEHLSDRLSPALADRLQRTFDLFDNPDGEGLWRQGPSLDDFEFTDPKLARRYPMVNLRPGEFVDGSALRDDAMYRRRDLPDLMGSGVLHTPL